MTRSNVPRRRGFAARITTLLVALGALPLMAPTCGDSGEGNKVFSKKSLIIPMDVCYQCTLESGLNPATASCTKTNYATPTGNDLQGGRACPQTLDKGDAIKAYGLVYQLIRNGIAVYWIINPSKDKLDGVDLTVQYAGGFPVLHYDWSTGGQGGAPTTAHAIDYMGGPFVVDGSDYDRASTILQQYKATFADAGATPGVNVHVSNVAFQAYAKKTMAGGWSAGGAVPPKLALLDIGSGNITQRTPTVQMNSAKNSEPVIQGYLQKAGIGTGTAGGSAQGPHGEIYDSLNIDDLQPDPSGLVTTSRLFKNGYSILWIPHWVAPGSCSNFTSNDACEGSLYTAAKIDQALKTIGAFVADGRDVFAECAGLGSLEGAFKRGVTGTGPSDYTLDYEDGASDGSTRLQTPLGVRYNELPDVNSSLSGTQLPAPDFVASALGSPLLQIGDFPFVPFTGAVEDHRPQDGTTYRSDVTRLISASGAHAAWDYFTYRAPSASAPRRGTVVYLGGHSYSGVQGAFQVAGSRLVLNTLFNLGASCTSSGVACNTGQPGVCSAGTFQCDAATGQPVCKPVAGATPSTEVCNGIDDDCDWEVDEGLQTECYGLGLGDPTLNQGVCRAGIRSCNRNPDGSYAMSACVGEVLPTAEVCNALDDDCDGATDEALSQACYEGPSSTIDPATGQPRPLCQAGTQTCTLGSWGACIGQVLPQPEFCGESAGNELDDDCNGTANDTCGCTSGQTQPCYNGPTGTNGTGICHGGTQTCTGGAWGACAGEVLPAAEVCGNAIDENCDGSAPTCPGCVAPAGGIGAVVACASIPSTQYPGAQRGVGQCSDGAMTCGQDSQWGGCVGETLPSLFEACDAVDNDCDGAIDEGAVCPTSFTCLEGVCVPEACGTELPAPEGYTCNPGGDPNGVVVKGLCGGGSCPAGEACRYGACSAACTDLDGDGASDQCAAGSVCAGGGCVAGGCYATPCPAGELCRNGACVADPCQGVSCPSGTFCREGDCVQACTFVSCAAGQKCGIDGFCEPDPCAGRTCPPGQRCSGGTCAADPCVALQCAAGQTCTVSGGDALCVDDPCTGIACPSGICSGGQCFSTSNPTGQGTVAPAAPATQAGGCGSGGAGALPALLGLLAVPLARRRARGAPRGGLAALLVAAALVGTACKEEDQATAFDPASCQETCGEERCVDVTSDASYCGGCAFTCAAGQVCVDSTCGAVLAPRIASLSPGSGPGGSVVPVTIQISGERFASGASVRVVSGATTRTYPATFVGADRLTVDLDLSGAGATTWQLRVVNPDRVISNAVPFSVVVPFPSVSGVVPATITAGTSASVLLTGSNFTPTSQCRIRSATVGDTGLASTVDASGVHCTVPAESLPPGTYDIWVVNEGNRASNVRQLQILSATATLLSVSPSSGGVAEIVSLTVTGTGFDVASRVLFDGCSAPLSPTGCALVNTPIVGTTFVSPTTLVAAVTLPACVGTCPHDISVRTGTGATTAALPFTVTANAPEVTTFAPATAYQGDAPVTLTFTGDGFITPTSIQLQPPGGTFSAAGVTMTTANSDNLAEGTISLVGQPEGAWLARIAFSGGGFSTAWPFRVLSNQAILRDYVATPAPERSGAAGTIKTSITFEVANLRPPYSGVKVEMFDPAGVATAELDPSPDPTGATSPLTVSGLSLANRNTGTYTFRVRNPNGATDSNALSFNVTPGMPTVTSVCRLAGAVCDGTNPTSAVQGPTPVPVRITGTNFAKPDASGNGSSVMVTANILPGWPNPCPGAGVTPLLFVPVPGTVEVRSPTEIVVQLDTLSAVALPGGTDYYVAVWNPGGSPSPQKSNGCAAPTSLPAFTIFP